MPHRRWRIAWLLGIGVLVNYFDRVNLSVSSNALVATFGISDVVFGYLSSAAGEDAIGRHRVRGGKLLLGPVEALHRQCGMEPVTSRNVR